MTTCSQSNQNNQVHNTFAQNVEDVPQGEWKSPFKKNKQKRVKFWVGEIACESTERQNSASTRLKTAPQLSPYSISSESTFFTTHSPLSNDQNKISQFRVSQQEKSVPIGDEYKPIVVFNKEKPLYIQNFSQLNSKICNYPDAQVDIQSQILKLSDLLRVARYAINEVINMAKDFEKRMRIQCGVEDLGLKFVCNSTCKVCKLDWQFNRIKPAKQFQNYQVSIFDLIEKLQLLDSKITRYQIILSLTKKLEVKTYNTIRQSLTEMEESLIQYSNLLYLKVKAEKHYPSFCYAYVELIWQKASTQKLVQDSKQIS